MEIVATNLIDVSIAIHLCFYHILLNQAKKETMDM